MDAYRQDKRLNQSLLKNFLIHDYQIAMEKINEPSTPSKELGSLVHGIIELRGAVPYNYEVSPYADFRKKEAREWKAEKQAQGISIIKQDELDQALAMANNVLHNSTPTLKAIINADDSKREQAFYDSEHKALLDCVSADGTVGIDYKTTSATSIEEFTRDVRKYHYDLQAAHYINLSYVIDFYFIAVSSVKPYPVWCFKCSDSFIDGGQHKLDKALDRYHNKLEAVLNVL
jgi:hypothetical protein